MSRSPGGPPLSMAAAVPPRRATLRRWLMVGLLMIGFGLCSLVLLGAVGISTGVGAGLLGLVFAALPVGVVVPAFLWIDRLESEPRRMLVLAFAWGAVVATAVALVANTGTMAIIAGATGTDPTSLGAVVVAPVVEESAKGLGVLVILWLQRREFDGVVDGLVYAGLVAGGFAFGENILYLGRAFNEAGGAGLVATFVLRGVVGPFAHPIFTCCTGVGIGVAVYRRRGPLRLVAPVAGWAVAVALHAAWNLSAVAGLEGFLTGYVLLQVPFFAAFVALAVWARRREARIISVELTRYARAGWLAPTEVAMLSSVPARRQAREWARGIGGRRSQAAMDRFQDAASDLAMLRHRMELGDVDDGVLALERHLLATMMECRSRFVGSRAL
ncbi:MULTISPECIES: PrsW family intramembrane metalloprotease [Arsenicicoccus]|uniref:PrsW family intramembrane metalloprotease n=1 Tax=Arsenicicoccus TaxID=267408 RepID=UPI00257F36E0|nr:MULTISPECIES: PrsW family intramembrane metalloprotease [Arsenicicoccus]